MVLPTRVSNSSDSIRSAYPASTVCGSAAWIFVAVRSGQPLSLAMVSAIWSWRFAGPSRMRRRYPARSATVVCHQRGRAARAAVTAASTSAAVADGTEATAVP
jgi:hypothetical protein